MNLFTTGRFSEKAIERGLLIESRVHVVLPDTGFIHTIRRVTKNDLFFLYYHKGTRQYVLAAWHQKPRRGTPSLCTEVEVWPGHPDRRPIDMHELLTKLSMTQRQHLEAMRDKIRARRSRERERREREGSFRDETVRKLRKRGLNAAADLMEIGIGAPVIDSSLTPEGREIRKDMHDFAVGKVSVDMAGLTATARRRS